MNLAAAYVPLADPSFWFGSFVGTALLSAVAFAWGRAANPSPTDFTGRVQRLLFVPFLALAIIGLLVLCGFGVVRVVGL